MFNKTIAVIVALGVSLAAFAQTTTISGVIVDEAGQPVIGAAVFVEGTSNGSAADINGTFKLDNVRTTDVLVVSSIGYLDQKVAVAGQKTFRIVLAEDAQMLEETVVIGYGVQKKSDITGSISSVGEETLANRPVETIQHALAGKIAGVQVFTDNGQPGSEPSIRIRGISSNSSGSSNPLYVVDGLKVSSIAYLDPNMIESMEILKDGASAAIYGAEAGNGVVLITTKQGKKNDGRVFYNMTYGFTSVGKKADLMNAEQYYNYQCASSEAQGNTVKEAWDGKTDTDWTDFLYGDGGHIQRHTIGFEKGNDKGSIYSAVSYLDNDGMYYGDKDYMKRLSFQVNASYQIKSWLQFVTNNSIDVADYSFTNAGINKEQFNSPYFYDPLTPPFYSANALPDYMKSLIAANGDDMFMKNENGDYAAVPRIIADRANPMTWYYNRSSSNKTNNIRGTAALNFTPVKGLVVTSRVGYNLSSSNYTFYSVPVYFSVTPEYKINLQGTTRIGRTYDWENFANYSHVFAGKHSLNAMVGMSYHHGWSNNTSGSTDELKSTEPNFRYLNYSTTAATDSVGGEEGENANISYFGRIGYTYDERYSIQATFRADAYDSSKLSPESRWGYFPSVSAGWIISNEEFMQGAKSVVDFLKLRASYGVNGNINVLSGYPYSSSLKTADHYPFNGIVYDGLSISDRLANPSLIWETSRQVDAGIDARFFGNRLTAALDYYNKNTTGQLITMTPPMSSGSSSVVRNVGLINNHGVEFELGWKDTKGDFSYGITANVATLHNKVMDLGNNTRIQGTGMVYFDVDQPVWSFWGYKYTGFDKDGNALYQHIAEDGSITSASTVSTADKVYLGSAIPKFTYGLTFNAEWKGIDLTIFGSGAAGGVMQMYTGGVAFANRPAVQWTDSFSVKGASAHYPKPAAGVDPYVTTSSQQLFNASYFKIKQITVGYTLPTKIVNYAKISGLRMFVSLDNFFCFTKYPGMDPEAISASSSMGIDYGNAPNPKTLTLGLNLSF